MAWTQIEQAAPQPERLPSGAGGSAVVSAGSAGDEPGRNRLRRHERPVIGPFDLAGTVFQRHARSAVLGSALFIVPAVVLNVIASNLVFDRFESFDDVAVSIPELVGGIDAATGVETTLAFVAIVANSLAVALAGGYLAALAVRSSLGLDTAIALTLRSMLRRLPALALAWTIGHSWIVIGSLVLVQVSSADLVGLAVLLLPVIGWLVTITLLASPVIVTERLGAIAGLRRASRLVRRRTGAAFAFVGLCVLIGGGLRVMISSMPQLIEATGFLTFGRFGALAEGIASQVSQLIIVPLIGLATAQFYLQMRMDHEGMDLVIEAGRVFG